MFKTISSLALLASAVAATNQPMHMAARQVSNTTVTPQSIPFEVVANRVWNYQGCFPYQVTHVMELPILYTSPQSIEDCLQAAGNSNYTYAAVSGNACYAGNTAGFARSSNSRPDSSCSTACARNSSQACGGPYPFSKRQLVTVSAPFLISLYSTPTTVTGATQAVLPLAPAPSTSAPAGVATALPNPAALSSVAGAVSYITYINVFLSICGCSAGVTASTVTTTLAYVNCGCTTSTPPTPPMSTITTLCATGCGPTPKIITLTVPCTTGPATIPLTTTTVPAVPSATITTVCIGGVCTPTLTTVCAGAACPIMSSTAIATPVTAVVCAGAGCPATTTATRAMFTGAAVANKAGTFGAVAAGVVAVAAVL